LKTPESEQRAQRFWAERVARAGHPGWNDPVIYAYDQIERLKLIEAMVSASFSPGSCALDFGCGNGDFSRLLLRLGFKVFGYDPFIKPSLRDKNFTYANSYAGLSQLSDIDLALSITTLDHILARENARDALVKIRHTLREGGRLYMLEYALDSSTDRETFDLKSDYQSFRTLEDWKDLLESTGFHILSIQSGSHPTLNPSPGYRKYARTLLARFRWRFPRLPLGRAWYDRLLTWRAAEIVRRGLLPPTPEARSPLKLVISQTL
jgi:SAM-dependent methyltransferase